LRYDADRAEVELVSDAVDGPYVGVRRFAAVEFVARLVQHIPGKGEVRVRYYGAYASRRRGWWRRRGVVLAGAGQEQSHMRRSARWLRGRRSAHGVDGGRSCCGWCTRSTSKCVRTHLRWVPRGGVMRILAFVTEHAVVTRILAHLARGGVDARAGPWAAAAG
jgi:hypothetical protein